MIRTRIALACAVLIACGCACSHYEPIAGTWQGLPLPLFTPPANAAMGTGAQVQTTTQLTFTPSAKGSHFGALGLNTTIEITDAVPFDGEAVATYQLDVAATASIEGVYHFDEDDEVIVALDFNTLKVKVDPDALALNENMLTGQQTPRIDSLRPALAQSYERKLTAAMRAEYGRLQKINDISVSKSGILSCEIADRDYTLRRVK